MVTVVIKTTMSVLVSLIVLLALPTASWAAGSQGNQAIQQPATLIAPKPDDKIAIYPQPSTRKRRIGYGIGGDAVTVLEKVGSNKGVTWNHVRFDNPPYADGWVQEEFLLFPTDSPQQQSNGGNGNRYFGNQKTNAQNSSQSYTSPKKY